MIAEKAPHVASMAFPPFGSIAHSGRDAGGSPPHFFCGRPPPERTGRLASTLRCLDPGCEGMTVEQAVMSEDSFDPRFPQAQQAWRAVWGGLYSQRISADAIRERLVERYGEEILVR
jgi:hypothetical protein